MIPILQLADKYNVKDLLKVGLDFMSRNVPLAARKNQVVSWYQFTTNCGYKDVAKLCLNFIKWNFDLVSESIDWPNLELDSLIQVLASSDLVTLQEVQVFRSVERWLRMDQITLSCMEHVRFPMMSPAQLADLLLSPLLSSHMETMVARMAAAMAYHRNTETAIGDILKYRHGDRLLTPRLYTQDKYCASLSVDYFLQVRDPSPKTVQPLLLQNYELFVLNNWIYY